LGLAGLDFAIFDTEHSALSFESVESLVRAAELVNLTPVVRVYDNRAPLKPRL
jgi:4-hydroxy-2-oxoheptanedioate aldolase